MLTVVAVNVAVHPWSHKVPMERSECGVNAGKMWARVAASGSLAMGRCPAAVLVRREPSGNATWIGCWLWHGTTGQFEVMKWPVAPVSATAAYLGCRKLLLFNSVLVRCDLALIGVISCPVGQASSTIFRSAMPSVLPPSMLYMVASRLCLGFLVRHVALLCPGVTRYP